MLTCLTEQEQQNFNYLSTTLKNNFLTFSEQMDKRNSKKFDLKYDIDKQKKELVSQKKRLVDKH